MVKMPGVAVHACSPSTWEVGAGRCQPGLHSEILSQKTEKKSRQCISYSYLKILQFFKFKITIELKGEKYHVIPRHNFREN
jgi:hypothetical protein